MSRYSKHLLLPPPHTVKEKCVSASLYPDFFWYRIKRRIEAEKSRLLKTVGVIDMVGKRGFVAN